jgi:hypothetical protein
VRDIVEIYYNDTLLELADNEPVPITKQVNEIANLNVFKSDFTREFRVKRTRAMEQLFENAGYLQSTSTIPYTELSAQCLVNGLEVIPKGKLALIRSDASYFYFSIYAGVKGIFDILKERKLNDLDISELNHTWNADNAALSISLNKNYKYLACDHSDDGLLIDVAGGYLQMKDFTTRPFIKTKYLFDKIMVALGVEIESDIETDALFAKMYNTINTLKVTSPNLSAYLSEIKGTKTFTVGIGAYYKLPIGMFANYGSYQVFNPKGVIDVTNDMVIAPFTAKYVFEINRLVITFPDYIYSIEVRVNGVAISASIDIIKLSYRVSLIRMTCDLSLGDQVTFYVKNEAAYFSTFELNHFKVASISYELARVGSDFELGNHLPPMTQSDFVKGICKFFGLVPDYDGITNTLRLWNINRLINNIPIAKDWTNYLSVKDADLTYTLDYARINHLKWKADKDVIEGTGDSKIIVNDETLEKEKTILDMPFSFCGDATRTIPVSPPVTETVARIGWYQTIPDSNEYKENESISPRLVTAEAVGVGVDYYDVVNTTSYVTTQEQSLKASVANITMDTVIGYNNAIVAMLNSTKALTLKFNLPAKEIANFDHSIPIYLEQYTEYFFVKKITNWTNGRLCSVELVRI